jgi:Kelch motif
MTFSDEKSGWKPIANMNSARAGSFAWVDHQNKKIYVAGGAVDANNTLTNSVEVYDIATNTWGHAGKIFFKIKPEF